MELTKTAEGYIVQVPVDVAAALGLHEGGDVKISKSSVITVPVSAEARDSAIERMKQLATPLPADYKFDREEANAR